MFQPTSHSRQKLTRRAAELGRFAAQNPFPAFTSTRVHSWPALSQSNGFNSVCFFGHGSFLRPLCLFVAILRSLIMAPNQGWIALPSSSGNQVLNQSEIKARPNPNQGEIKE